MDLDGAAALAKELMGRFGLASWTFRWNRRKRSLGLCRYRERQIELSMYFVKANGEELVRETVLHEIAHALAGVKAAHGPLWKAMCAKVGCHPVRCEGGVAVMPRGRWVAQCTACGKVYHRFRQPGREAKYWCVNCGPERGQVTFHAAE
jgi:predicted SprT family Zn-dependent metalloprotease